MKKTRRLLALLLALMMVLALQMTVMAVEESDPAGSDETPAPEVTEPSETEEPMDEEGVPDWKTEKQLLEDQKDAVEAEKDAVEAEKDALEAQLEAAEESGDATLVADLKAQIKALKEEMTVLKAEMKAILQQMKELVKNKYSKKELKKLEEVADELDELDDVTPMPVDTVYLEDGDVKFDTPPVIKGDRILIPVRAISEAMGADVLWDGEARTVTIVKEEITILFYIDEGTVFVNGVETEIDVPGNIMNSRTMVPLRFIAEQLGLKVIWDSETETAILSEEK